MTMHPGHRTALLPLCCAVLAACQDTGARPNAAIIRDSAGVKIVENARPAWGGASAWHVAAAPTVTIGEVEGDAPYLLSRVLAATRLSDGRVVILDGGTQQLRYFDGDGAHLQSRGGAGDGPGEFRGALHLFRMTGDSLLVADVLASRFTVLDDVGQFVTSYSAGVGRASAFGRFASGRLAVTRSADPVLAVATGHVRVPLNVLAFNPGESAADTVARLPGGEEYRAEVGRGIANYAVPFGRRPVTFVHGEHLYVGSGDAFEIEIVREDGTLERIVRAAVAVPAVSPQHRERWRDEQLRGASDSRRAAIERLLRDVPSPAVMPAYSALHVDADANLWIRPFAPPGEEALDWFVFDAEDRWLGLVTMPPRLTVMEIGRDYVLGVYRDALDVEHVRLHDLVR
jgi:hypothetical protein